MPTDTLHTIPEISLAIIVNPALPLGLLANTVGAIGIGLGAVHPTLGSATLTDKEGRTIHVSSKKPVPILQADADTIRALMLKAMTMGPDVTLTPFPAFARALHDYNDYVATFPTRDLTSETIDGLGLAGTPKKIKSLTGSLKLLR